MRGLNQIQDHYALVFIVRFNPTFLLPSGGCLLPGEREAKPVNTLRRKFSLRSSFFGDIDHIGGFHLNAQSAHVGDDLIVELIPRLVSVSEIKPLLPNVKSHSQYVKNLCFIMTVIGTSSFME